MYASTDVVSCPRCNWSGQVAACNCDQGEPIYCPLCRCNVEAETDEPVIVHSGERGEWSPLADTH